MISNKETTSLKTETPNVEDYFNGDSLRTRVFIDKYALKDKSGKTIEKSPREMWRRVAKAIASTEKTEELKQQWESKFHWLLEDFRSVPGGRILFGAGNDRRATLLNCYVNPIHEDTLESIFDWCKEAARTYSFGGGVGTDISILRPKGAPVNNAAIHSSGSVSFMNLFSLTTGTIGQSGRRGALMLTIADSHPDVLDFCRVKRDLHTVRYANISVRVSDSLMKAVEEGKSFELYFENDKTKVKKSIRAQELWSELINGARDWAEPGLIFWDTIKRESTSEYNDMEVISTNPCSEIPLEKYGDCCLGNINLSRFIKEGFQETASIEWGDLEKAIRTMVRFLDNVLDYNMDRHPLKAHSKASMKSRRIGVGFTGFGDMLCLLRKKYDSDEAIELTDHLFEKIKNITYDESVNLAIERGVFPAFDVHKHMRSPYIQRLDSKVQERIAKHGLRNVALLTVPPVGSGAALAGGSSGVEPIFDFFYTRRSESLTQEYFKVYHPLVKQYLEKTNGENESTLPPYFVTAHKVSAEKRVQMQATIQKHIDHAISSTVNLPREATAEDVAKIYFLAWKTGCKGITVYREGSREGVLITEEESKRKEPPKEKEQKASETRLRPKVTEGRTERVETPRGPVYVTVNEDEFGLCEVFVRSLDAEAEVSGRLVSLLLRTEVDPREVLEQLWRVKSRELSFDRSSDGTIVKVTTIAQGIAVVIGRYLYGDSFNPDKEFPRISTLPEPTKRARQQIFKFGRTNEQKSVSKQNSDEVSDFQENGQKNNGKSLQSQSFPVEFVGVCPDCGDSLANENGCSVCKGCGFSRCG